MAKKSGLPSFKVILGNNAHSLAAILRRNDACNAFRHETKNRESKMEFRKENEGFFTSVTELFRGSEKARSFRSSPLKTTHLS